MWQRSGSDLLQSVKKGAWEKRGDNLIFRCQIICLAMYVSFEGKQNCLEYNINSTVNNMQSNPKFYVSYLVKI